jgi:hypothetical protein
MSRPQFRLRSLFILTAIVAVGCLVGPPIARPVIARVREWMMPKKQCLGARSGPAIPMIDKSLHEEDLATPQAGLPIFEQWRAAELIKPISDAPVQASPPTD